MVVVDASAVLEILLLRRFAGPLQERLLERDEILTAPHLIDIEVLHVIRRYARFGDLDEPRARTAIAFHRDLPIERYRHDDLMGAVWELREKFTASDAMYIVLGIHLRATLITTDLRLARAAESLLPVEVFA